MEQPFVATQFLGRGKCVTTFSTSRYHSGNHNGRLVIRDWVLVTKKCGLVVIVLISMSALMFPEAGGNHKRLATEATLEWPLSGVHAIVLCKAGPLSKALATFPTLMRALP